MYQDLNHLVTTWGSWTWEAAEVTQGGRGEVVERIFRDSPCFAIPGGTHEVLAYGYWILLPR